MPPSNTGLGNLPTLNQIQNGIRPVGVGGGFTGIVAAQHGHGSELVVAVVDHDLVLLFERGLAHVNASVVDATELPGAGHTAPVGERHSVEVEHVP